MTLSAPPSPLSLSFVKITGPEASSFLQGQLTIDVPSLQPQTMRYAAQCNAKGKMVGLGYLYNSGDAYFYIQSSVSAQTSYAQFKKFGVFAKAEFNLPENDQHCVAIRPHSIDFLANTAVITPVVEHVQGLQFAIFTGQLQQSEILNFEDANAEFVQNGIPFLYSNVDEQWIPQMLNVQALNGIDFDKGCYMGQEVVARTHYLGKNKRALFTFSTSITDVNEQIKIDDPVYRRLGENWRKSGSIVNFARQNNKLLISAVLPNDVSEQDVLALTETESDRLSPIPLPYVVNSSTSSIKNRKHND
ncbi:hypothetical protein J3L16_06405 [Alteromonas sp. 5E99-2]|uniref:CAF17-like 4Fe-4S cluster assembly/insertion protein YgfZ n=1 Tax=Alteromonas sp. 5E99-2 TaxID=2817683 RepID=UPI001A9970DE|nr:hypothetical protein [Alteromonas sp. 5E99-2]MBO1255317.1 hypothetical protein [Alteromonas sp. 5E99-2]